MRAPAPSNAFARPQASACDRLSHLRAAPERAQSLQSTREAPSFEDPLGLRGHHLYAFPSFGAAAGPGLRHHPGTMRLQASEPWVGGVLSGASSKCGQSFSARISAPSVVAARGGANRLRQHQFRKGANPCGILRGHLQQAAVGFGRRSRLNPECAGPHAGVDQHQDQPAVASILHAAAPRRGLDQ